MEKDKSCVFTHFNKDVRKRMLTGLLLILPVYVTFFVVKFLFGFVGGTLAPVIKKVLQFYGVALPKSSLDEFIITFFGLILTFIALYFIGIFAANFVGTAIISYFENHLTKTPVIENIYSSVKQIVHSVSGIYPTNPVPQVEYVLDHSQSKFVLVKDQEQADKVLAIKE